MTGRRSNARAVHHGGARPVPTPRSPTEGDALAEVDVTTEEVLVPPPATDGPLYADTRTPTAPVPVWEGPGTDTTAGP